MRINKSNEKLSSLTESFLKDDKPIANVNLDNSKKYLKILNKQDCALNNDDSMDKNINQTVNENKILNKKVPLSEIFPNSIFSGTHYYKSHIRLCKKVPPMINTEKEDQDTIALIPSSYNKIGSFDRINPPLNSNNKSNFLSISSNKEKQKKLSKTKIVFPSNIYSMISFNWVYDLITTIKRKNKLKLSYLGEVSDNYKSKEILNEIKPKWYGKYYSMLMNDRQEKKKTIYPLLMTLVMANLGKILFTLSLFLLMSALDFFGVLIFEELLGRFKEQKEKNSRVAFLNTIPLYKLVIYMILYKLLSLIFERQTVFISELLSFRTKAQLNLLIYDKLLKIPLFNTGKFNEGQIINLFQIDSESFGELVDYSTYIIQVPFKIIYSVYLLFVFFKLAFIPGSIILFLLAAFFWIFGRKEEKYQNENMKATDDRMNIT